MTFFLSTLSLRRATGVMAAPITPTYDFLSTLSLRRATINPANQTNLPGFFYPRSPCGERRWLRCWQLAARDISIHALLAESDVKIMNALSGLKNFYPRSPCGERPVPGGGHINETNFYPRSPCGERLKLFPKRLCNSLFLSTLSLRRATSSVQCRL